MLLVVNGSHGVLVGQHPAQGQHVLLSLQAACVAMAPVCATCCLSLIPCSSGSNTATKVWGQPCCKTSVKLSQKMRPWGSVPQFLLPCTKVTPPCVVYEHLGNGDKEHMCIPGGSGVGVRVLGAIHGRCRPWILLPEKNSPMENPH